MTEVRCGNCGADNPKRARFCIECGTPIPARCPRCDAEAPPRARFCAECGCALPAAAPATAGAGAPDWRASEAERRQVTVLFCDLVGSTLLAEALDPEDLRDVLGRCHAVCSEAVQRFGGKVAKYLGDGVLVYFGYPVAHEDDAQRAVRAALGIVEGMAPQAQELREQRDLELAVRLGIHTGLVVAGDIGVEGERTVDIVGETPNVAARLQDLAAPNSIVISGETQRLVQGYFEFRPLGPQVVKGLSRRIETYQVLRESAARSRLDAASAKRLTPFVGRDRETRLLRSRWEAARQGRGQVVLLGGEAGIGKSRLVHALKEQLSETPRANVVECYCSAYHQNSVLFPVTDMLQRAGLDFERDDAPQEKLRRIEQFLERRHPAPGEAVPLLASLLSVSYEASYTPLQLSPERQRERTLELLAHLLLHRPCEETLLFIVEDLHWADPSTLECLERCFERVRTAPILAVLSSRPEFTPPWPPQDHITRLTLDRLEPGDVEVLARCVAHGVELPAAVLQQVVAKTDGVPLFVEELTLMLLESGELRQSTDALQATGPLRSLEIPSTLQDSLMARLDRLSTIKEVAQVAAVLGRTFSFELLAAVSALEEGSLRWELDRLVEAGLLQTTHDDGHYHFKHALIQDAAYESLLRSRRQQVHERAARALEAHFGEVVAAQPELLAHHFTEGGLPAAAIRYWQRAADLASTRSAHTEAVHHANRGLALLPSLPEGPERLMLELGLQLAVGAALMTTTGYAAPAVAERFSRAQDLCHQLGRPPQLFPVLHGLWRFHQVRGEYQLARTLTEQMLALAREVRDPELLLEAEWAHGVSLFWLGEPAPALPHLRRTLEAYDPARSRIHCAVYSQDPAVAAYSYAGLSLALQGFLDQGAETVGKAARLAAEVAHPFSLGFALQCSGILYQLRREVSRVYEVTRREVDLCRENGYPFFVAGGIGIQGWALTAQGQAEEGVAALRSGLSAWRATGAELAAGMYLCMLADACLMANRHAEGLAVVDEGLAVYERNGEAAFEPEIRRLKGELLLLDREAGGLAEACFHEALEAARRRQMRLWELRAAMSLGRLWRRDGRPQDARRLLNDVLSQFTEGFDTPVLREAAELLQAWS
jgi:class 3 adenylate cyclase/predicted ATPase